jgi:hypothetical protein
MTRREAPTSFEGAFRPSDILFDAETKIEWQAVAAAAAAAAAGCQGAAHPLAAAEDSCILQWHTFLLLQRAFRLVFLERNLKAFGMPQQPAAMTCDRMRLKIRQDGALADVGTNSCVCFPMESFYGTTIH